MRCLDLNILPDNEEFARIRRAPGDFEYVCEEHGGRGESSTGCECGCGLGLVRDTDKDKDT